MPIRIIVGGIYVGKTGVRRQVIGLVAKHSKDDNDMVLYLVLDKDKIDRQEKLITLKSFKRWAQCLMWLQKEWHIRLLRGKYKNSLTSK